MATEPGKSYTKHATASSTGNAWKGRRPSDRRAATIRCNELLQRSDPWCAMRSQKRRSRLHPYGAPGMCLLEDAGTAGPFLAGAVEGAGIHHRARGRRAAHDCARARFGQRALAQRCAETAPDRRGQEEPSGFAHACRGRTRQRVRVLQDFGLVSFDRQGRQRWQMPLGPFNNAYGMASSPIVVDDIVVLVCDQSIGSFMIAANRDTGQRRWRIERPEAKTGHSTPIVYRPRGAPAQLLVPGSFYLTAYSLASGQKLWWVHGLAFEMKATPVIEDGVVFIHGTSSSQFEDGAEPRRAIELACLPNQACAPRRLSVYAVSSSREAFPQTASHTLLFVHNGRSRAQRFAHIRRDRDGPSSPVRAADARWHVRPHLSRRGRPRGMRQARRRRG